VTPAPPRIAYRELSKEERQSPTHFCERCETWQKRGELHRCTPTPRWKALKAAMHAKTPLPPPCITKAAETPVPDLALPPLSTFQSTPPHGERHKPDVDTGSVNTNPVHKPTSVHKPDVDTGNADVDKPQDRTEYYREYKRKKRAEAKENAA
jgi:hypothetical protein